MESTWERTTIGTRLASCPGDDQVDRASPLLSALYFPLIHQPGLIHKQ